MVSNRHIFTASKQLRKRHGFEVFSQNLCECFSSVFSTLRPRFAVFRAVYFTGASQFLARKRGRFQIDAFWPFWAVYATSETALKTLHFRKCFQKHPSVTDPVEPDPSENLFYPVPSNFFYFTSYFLCFPSDCAVYVGVTLKYLTHFLKTKNQTK